MNGDCQRRSWTASALVALTATCLFGIAGTNARAQQPPTLADIIDGIDRTEKLLFENKSLLMRYARTHTETITPGSIMGGLLPAEWVLAYRGDKWFMQRRFTKPKRSDDLLVPAEPKVHVISDHFVIDWDQYSREAVLDSMDASLGANLYAGLFYTRNLSFNAARYIAKSEAVDLNQVRKKYRDDVDLPFLPEYLSENKYRYQVLSIPEEIDGALCWIVEWPGMDRIWVDPTRGFAVPRRRYAWEPGKPCRFEFYNKDYREVKPGLWLPETQVEDTYTSVVADRSSLWGKVAGRSEYKLLAVEFDSVPENQFDVMLPAGTCVIDNYRRLFYTVSRSPEPFAQAIADAKAGKQASHASTWLWGLSIACLGVLVGFLAYRWRLTARLKLG
jgi:hypothetical protein